ncbi:MAG TPA: prolyl oligopeptidase family serine peptidase [Steroidobacteraceae bacterium]|jgi:prolyl oligopeptidase|nr:prolyl oligopeptidase family serine peptidase [Steroidobacteraceae bacterium]
MREARFALVAVGLLIGSLAWSAADDKPAAAKKPAAAPVKPIVETLFGRKITDDYRYMEALDPATIEWMKSQGAYTRSLLDSIKPLAHLKTEVAKFSASFGLIQGYVHFGTRGFYEERAPGSDNFDLMVTDGAGIRKLVDVAALRAENGGKPFAINYFLASPDGNKVAVGISEGGSEDASITVYDAASGAKLGGPVDRAQFGATSWSDDSKLLYFVRLQKTAANAQASDKYLNATADAWDLKSEPVALLGASLGHGPALTPVEAPAIAISVGAPVAAALSINGVQNELAMWLAPAARVSDPKVTWTKFLTREDEVTNVDMRGGEIFLLSHKDAPTFKVLMVHAGQPLTSASTLVPARADRVIEGIHAAADALYLLARRGAYSQLLRIPAGTTSIEEVQLPFRGHIGEAFTDPRTPGITLDLSSFTTPPAEFVYQPTAKAFSQLKIGAHGDFAASDYLLSDLQAKATDGTLVPLSLVQPKSAKGAQVTIIEAYGSYGISELADFSIRRAAAMRQGITYGVCHVRGGGELGEQWRLGGKDANKHNTWGDLIACSEYLIARGITAPAKLFILGGSAGGITMGRSLTERPDLFAGVLDLVPSANTLRAEFTAGGPANIPEFGSITTAEGLSNLYEMDTIQHVKKGTQYPAVMITTGLNDPRVAPWEPAKLAAALQASGSRKPVLLRIDEEAGHGIGSTKTQGDELGADTIAFVFWRAGLPEWQPGD